MCEKICHLTICKYIPTNNTENITIFFIKVNQIPECSRNPFHSTFTFFVCVQMIFKSLTIAESWRKRFLCVYIYNKCDEILLKYSKFSFVFPSLRWFRHHHIYKFIFCQLKRNKSMLGTWIISMTTYSFSLYVLPQIFQYYWLERTSQRTPHGQSGIWVKLGEKNFIS